jgi:hypothetical protein
MMYQPTFVTVQKIPPTLYMMYQPTFVHNCIGYERLLVHHVQSRRNCLYSYVRTSLGTSCTKSVELSVQLRTSVMYQPTFVHNCIDNSSDFVHDVPTDVRT